MQKNLGLFLFMVLLLLLSACSKNEKLYEENMGNANQAIEKSEYEEALAFVEEALSLKENDELALAYEKQIKYFIEAKALYVDGEFIEASELLQSIIDEENGSNLLVTQAKEAEEKMSKLRGDLEDYEVKLADSMLLMDEKKYEEALTVIEGLEGVAIDHAIFSKLTKEREELDKEVIQLMEEEKEKEAERQRKEAEEKKRKEEEQKKKQIGDFAGYYLFDDNFACHITETYYHCALPYSDYIIDVAIDEIIENKGNEIKLIVEGETMTWYLEDNKQTLVWNEKANRVTKDEANAVFDGFYELR